MTNRRIIVIGSGIAALSSIFELNKKGFRNILCLSHEDFAPSCSLTSTGINALRGTEAGLSDLGDILIKSHKAFTDFVVKYNPKGVTKTNEIHCWSGDNSKMKRRYKSFSSGRDFSFFKHEFINELNFVDNSAFIISPEIFLKWLTDESTFEHKREFVTEINENSISTNGKVYNFDHLIIASGFLAKNYLHLVDDKIVAKNLFYSKPVSGAYIEFSADVFKTSHLTIENSFSFVFEDTHLIFRKDINKIIVGSTSENNSLNFLANKTELKRKYLKLTEMIGGEFPDFSLGELKAGVRHKTQNREPFWGLMTKDISGIWGLYKTGWSMSFLAAIEVSESL